MSDIEITSLSQARTYLTENFSGRELNALIRRACRKFEADVTDDEAVEVLNGEVRTKVKYLLGFIPVKGEDGLLAFLTRAARRSARRRERAAVPAEPRASARSGREPTAVGKVANRFEVHITGRPDRIVAALGFKRDDDFANTRRPVMVAEHKGFAVVADPNGVRLQKIAAESLPAATRFLRSRLNDNSALLRRARVVPAGGADAIDPKLMTRAHIRDTRRGFIIAAAEPKSAE